MAKADMFAPVKQMDSTAGAIYPTLFDQIPGPLQRATRRPRIGVLFVHGMGSQSRGDTLREMASPLVDWLQEWHSRRGGGFRVLSANINPDPWDETPSNAVLELPAHGNSPLQTWILAEAWWAAQLRSPSYLTMLFWGGQLIYRVVMQRVLDALSLLPETWDLGRRKHLGLGEKAERFFEQLVDSLCSALLVVVYLGLAIWGFLPMIGLLALIKLPIPLLRPILFARLERLLIEDLGDVYTYLYDELQATQIRGSVHKGLRWLVERQRCDGVVVVAHSQGTVVAVDALGSAELPERILRKVRTLVTVGQALNIAWGSGSSRGRARRKICGSLQIPTWIDVWAQFDYANGTKLKPSDGTLSPKPTSMRVFNEKNLLTEHSGYFTNHEQYTAALVEAVEARTPGTPSRFFTPAVAHRLRRERRRRVTLISLLGFLATFLPIAAILWRYNAGISKVADDAAALWSLVDRGARYVLPTPADDLAFSAPPNVIPSIEVMGLLARDSIMNNLQGAAVFAFFAIPFGIVFMLLFGATLQPWNRLASLYSARPFAATGVRATVARWDAIGALVGFVVISEYIVLACFAIIDMPPLTLVIDRILGPAP